MGGSMGGQQSGTQQAGTGGGAGAQSGQQAQGGEGGMMEQAHQMADQAMHYASDAARTAYEQAGGVAGQVGEYATDAAGYVSGSVEQATSALGHGLVNAGSTLREQNYPGLSSVASTLESTGHYLEEQGLGDMTQDVTNVIRRNPIPSLLIAIGVGYMLAHATRNSNRA
jgi:hypothetical protein